MAPGNYSVTANFGVAVIRCAVAAQAAIGPPSGGRLRFRHLWPLRAEHVLAYLRQSPASHSRACTTTRWTSVHQQNTYYSTQSHYGLVSLHLTDK